MDTPYKKVILVECGACMQDNIGKFIGNSCFFNSLKAGLIQLDASYSSLNYSDFLALGGWNKGFKGSMVDTISHASNIEQLSRNLGYKISIFTEIIPGVTNSTIYAPFGVEGIEIRIIRLRGFAHFNLMLWHTDQRMIEEDRRLAQELEKNMIEEEKARKKALSEQSERDMLLAKFEQESYIKVTQRREEARKQALRKQEEEDSKLVKMMVEMNI
jgi:hypothetical protein